MRKARLLNIFCALYLLAPALEAEVISNVSFISPTGTVSPTDSIDIWVRLSLDPSSDTLTYDSSITPFSGLPVSFVPTESDIYNPATGSYETVAYASYTDVYMTPMYSTCGNTFTGGCGLETGEYKFVFNNINDSNDPFILNPGESRDFLLGTYIPISDSVTPGDYIYYYSSIGFSFGGRSVDDQFLIETTFLDITCPIGDTTCAFTRTVSAVPAPAAFWLFSFGMTGLFGWSQWARTRLKE